MEKEIQILDGRKRNSPIWAVHKKKFFEKHFYYILFYFTYQTIQEVALFTSREEYNPFCYNLILGARMFSGLVQKYKDLGLNKISQTLVSSSHCNQIPRAISFKKLKDKLKETPSLSLHVHFPNKYLQ